MACGQLSKGTISEDFGVPVRKGQHWFVASKPKEMQTNETLEKIPGLGITFIPVFAAEEKQAHPISSVK